MRESNLKTPVLFIIYNRPDLTFKVFQEIRNVRPEKLYIVADGPKPSKPDDLKMCLQSRSVINRIDWSCTIKTKFLNENIGCKYNVSNAIKWFFENEEEGIILEDDCLPNKSFFEFCAVMLNKYRYDNSVGHIGGNNFMNNHNGSSHYFYSKYAFIWGWATWRRAWRHYDLNLTSFPDVLVFDRIAQYFRSWQEKYTFYNKFLQVFEQRKDTWDYQWLFALWSKNLKSVVPPVNLVKNIGFDNRATHTRVNRKLDHLFAESIEISDYLSSGDFNDNIDLLFYRLLYRRSFISNIIIMFKIQIFKLKFYAKNAEKKSQPVVLQVSP